jgi:hypothetical protein
MSSTIRVLLVDNHAMLRHGITPGESRDQLRGMRGELKRISTSWPIRPPGSWTRRWTRDASSSKSQAVLSDAVEGGRAAIE